MPQLSTVMTTTLIWMDGGLACGCTFHSDSMPLAPLTTPALCSWSCILRFVTKHLCWTHAADCCFAMSEHSLLQTLSLRPDSLPSCSRAPFQPTVAAECTRPALHTPVNHVAFLPVLLARQFRLSERKPITLLRTLLLTLLEVPLLYETWKAVL